MKGVLLSGLLFAFSFAAVAGAIPPAPYQLSADSHDYKCALALSHFVEDQLTDQGLFDAAERDRTRTDVLLLAREKLTDELTKYVYRMTLYAKDGTSLDVVVVGTGNAQECPAGVGLKTYVVSAAMGELPQGSWVSTTNKAHADDNESDE